MFAMPVSVSPYPLSSLVSESFPSCVLHSRNCAGVALSPPLTITSSFDNASIGIVCNSEDGLIIDVHLFRAIVSAIPAADISWAKHTAPP
jgi:hypothetical protein